MDLNLSTVRNEIHDSRTKWFDIGIELKVDVSTLKSIESMYSNAKDCLREVITEWLKAVSPKPTWRSLVDALRRPVVDESKLAAVLEAKYCSCITEGRGLPTSTHENNLLSKSHSAERSTSFPHVSKPLVHQTGRAQSVQHDNWPELDVLRENLLLLSAAPRVNVTLKFTSPSKKDGFWERVFERNVLLEKARFDVKKLSVVGDIRVTNLYYEKEVSVLCTWNEWVKKFEVRAEFNGNRNNTDVFTFELPICCSHYSTMLFAIRYRAGGKVFWDNNEGENYSIQIKFLNPATSISKDSETQTVTDALDDC